MTGPTPKISVSVVPGARTVTASFFLVPSIWASMRRRSPWNSAAGSQRASATAPDGSADSRTWAALPAVISLEMPPGISSQRTAWSRQATCVRVRPRSRWRLDHSLTTAAWFSAATGRGAAERSAKIATERATERAVESMPCGPGQAAPVPACELATDEGTRPRVLRRCAPCPLLAAMTLVLAVRSCRMRALRMRICRCQRRRMSRRCCTGHRRSNSVGSPESSARRCSIKVT